MADHRIQDAFDTSGEKAEPYRRTFLSYAHEDLALARSVAQMLRESGVPIWFDEGELPYDLYGAELFHALYIAVARSDAMLELHTETYRNRQRQTVPGWTLANATAPPQVPLNKAPIPGREVNLWRQKRSPERPLFKHVMFDVTEGADATLYRYGVYFASGNTYGYPNRVITHTEWEECHTEYAPGFGTLLGQEIRLSASSVAAALPVLLAELRAPNETLEEQQHSKAYALTDVKKASEYTPNRYDLMGFGPGDAPADA